MEDKASCPWKLDKAVQHAKFLLWWMDYQLQHDFREANNQVVDSLEKHSYDQSCSCNFSTFTSLPRGSTGLYGDLDRLSISTLR